MPRKPLTLYRFRLSGHSHRVELFLSLLGVPVEMAEVDLGKGEHKTPEFLAKNPFGQVPVLADDGLVLADSNAILIASLPSTIQNGAGIRRIPSEPRPFSAGCPRPRVRS